LITLLLLLMLSCFSCVWLSLPGGQRWQPTRLRCPWDSPGKYTVVGCHFLLQCMKVKGESEVAQLCPTFHDPMDYSLPGCRPNSHGWRSLVYWSGLPLPSPLITLYCELNSLVEIISVTFIQEISRINFSASISLFGNISNVINT